MMFHSLQSKYFTCKQSVWDDGLTFCGKVMMILAFIYFLPLQILAPTIMVVGSEQEFCHRLVIVDHEDFPFQVSKS